MLQDGADCGSSLAQFLENRVNTLERQAAVIEKGLSEQQRRGSGGSWRTLVVPSLEESVASLEQQVGEMEQRIEDTADTADAERRLSEVHSTLQVGESRASELERRAAELEHAGQQREAALIAQLEEAQAEAREARGQLGKVETQLRSIREVEAQLRSEKEVSAELLHEREQQVATLERLQVELKEELSELRTARDGESAKLEGALRDAKKAREEVEQLRAAAGAGVVPDAALKKWRELAQRLRPPRIVGGVGGRATTPRPQPRLATPERRSAPSVRPSSAGLSAGSRATSSMAVHDYAKFLADGLVGAWDHKHDTKLPVEFAGFCRDALAAAWQPASGSVLTPRTGAVLPSASPTISAGRTTGGQQTPRK